MRKIVASLLSVASMTVSAAPLPVPQGACVPQGPRVALTFDDGPYKNTPTILSILHHHNVPATFFVLGQRAQMYPQILQEIANDGHEIGVHTYDHANLFKLTPTQQNAEIQKGYNAIRAVLPQTPIVYWRAPYGNVPRTPIAAVTQLGLKHVGWTIDTLDWTKEDVDTWRMRVASHLSVAKRQIILMHDHASVSVNELETLIVSLRANGYQLVSVSMFNWPTCLPPSLYAHTDDDPTPAEVSAPQL